MIKKLIIIVTASLWLLSSADTVFADFWRMVKPGQWSTYFGIPIKVKDVLTTQEIEKDGLFYYTYKLIIQRPGKDNGWGIAHIGSLNYRLYCWAATANINPYVTFFND